MTKNERALVKAAKLAMKELKNHMPFTPACNAWNALLAAVKQAERKAK